jgi:hypothetical protein
MELNPNPNPRWLIRRIAMRFFVLALCFLVDLTHGKISTLDIEADARRLFAVETFGFLVGGVHKMELNSLKVLHPSRVQPFLATGAALTTVRADFGSRRQTISCQESPRWLHL